MNYCFASNGSLQQMAILASPKTGRLLEVKSTLPGLQVYTGNWLNTKGKFNVDYVSIKKYAVKAKVITNWCFGRRLTNLHYRNGPTTGHTRALLRWSDRKILTKNFRWKIQRLHWSHSTGQIHQTIQIFLRQHFDLDSDTLKLSNLIFIKSKVKTRIHGPEVLVQNRSVQDKVVRGSLVKTHLKSHFERIFRAHLNLFTSLWNTKYNLL